MWQSLEHRGRNLEQRWLIHSCRFDQARSSLLRTVSKGKRDAEGLRSPSPQEKLVDKGNLNTLDA